MPRDLDRCFWYAAFLPKLSVSFQSLANLFFGVKTMVNEVCAEDSLERRIIHGSTNSIASVILSVPNKFAADSESRYAFNAWIPLVTYNTTYAPRFLVGNSVTVALIVCAACTLSLAIYLERRDSKREKHTGSV